MYCTGFEYVEHILQYDIFYRIILSTFHLVRIFLVLTPDFPTVRHSAVFMNFRSPTICCLPYLVFYVRVVLIVHAEFGSVFSNYFLTFSAARIMGAITFASRNIFSL